MGQTVQQREELFLRVHGYRSELEPVWNEALRRAEAQVGPTPTIPKPIDFGINLKAGDELPLLGLLEEPNLASKGSWVLMGLACFCLLASLAVPVPQTTSYLLAAASFSALWVANFGLAYIFNFPVYLRRWRFDEIYPRWREYRTAEKQAMAGVEKYEAQLKVRANEIAEAELRRVKHDGQYWRSLTGLQFEQQLAKLFTLKGYEVEMTPYTGDGGVDLLLRKNGKLIAVQCKAHQGRISISTARELYAAMMDFKADAGIIACLEGVTRPLELYAEERGISVLNLYEILKMQRTLTPNNPAARP